MKNTILCLISFVLLSLRVSSQLRLPAVLSEGMVLQQKDSVTLWGWGNPSERININTSWNIDSYTVTVTNGAS